MKDIRTEIGEAELRDYQALAQDLASEARAIIKLAMDKGFSINQKKDGSFVTSVDLRVEQRLREMVQDRYPAHGILGEEYPQTHPSAPYRWIFDPIDGTEDFIHGVPAFGTIIGLHYQGKPVVGVIDHPALDLRCSAAFGMGTYKNGERVKLSQPGGAGSERVMLAARDNFMRHGDDGRLFDAITRTFVNHRIYRSCYGHVCAATGAADVMVEYGNHLWDLAASQLLVEEAGGKYVIVQDLDTPADGRIYGAVFGKPLLVDRLVAMIAQAR